MQTVFLISKRKPHTITGILDTSGKTVMRICNYKKKKCAWCGQYYKPRTAHQLYCSRECSAYSTAEKTLERVRRFRRKYRDVWCLLDRYHTLGTGELGAHAISDEDEELKRIQNEMRKLGLRGDFYTNLHYG